MAIKLIPGGVDSDVFMVGNRTFTKGKFFLYRKGETVLVNSNEMGAVVAFGHYTDFEDEQGNSFTSVDELMEYLNGMIFGKSGANMNRSQLDYQYTEGSVLQYDRKRMFGSQSNPLSGQITDYNDGSIDSTRGEGIIFHKDEEEPIYPSGFVKGEGSYASGELNLIRYQYFTKGFKLYTIESLTEYDGVDVFDGLVLYYDFSKGGDIENSLLDQSGYNNNGYLEHPEDAIWDMDAGTVTLGNNEDTELRSYFRVPFTKSLGFLKHQFTILVDFGKRGQFSGVIFGTCTAGSGNNGINMGIVSDGRVELEVNEESLGSGGRGRSSSPALYPTDGSTEKFVITYDGRYVRFYYNGTLNKSNEVSEGEYIYNEEDWYIGKQNGKTVSSITIFRHFAAWDRVLSDEEIKNVWNHFGSTEREEC
ncbi:hypothetical protein DN752_15870 [Echinicola strongylocentroti]|uniref:LamG domain-containing protein n=1 Tax=Echinicola strongylocentroti TaxID=1795355 RepID=A0A2Z4IL78_9BACT|nr:LamG-like jellyroll fold domain-containing protein [Echinicola strongylocentroti]AWW31480.1 hypothetical protein DN752_15870 [Echinicola strongylocentroti]